MRLLAAGLVLLSGLLLGACATRFDPDGAGERVPPEEVGLVQRAAGQRQGDLQLGVAVLADQQSLEGFGVPQGKRPVTTEDPEYNYTGAPYRGPTAWSPSTCSPTNGCRCPSRRTSIGIINHAHRRRTRQTLGR